MTTLTTELGEARTADPTVEKGGVAKPSMPIWGHFFVVFVLLAGAAVLDVYKPFNKTWSMFYVLPLLYAGWTLRGRAAIGAHAVTILMVFLVPLVFRPELMWRGTGFYNRSTGTLLGLVIIVLMAERRRYIDALQCVNRDLEARIDARSLELLRANESLRIEITEREKAELDRKRLEDELRQSQKMEAIGYLAGGVAHDFNNLLTVILGYASHLREQVSANIPAQQSIDEISNACERAAELTHQLLAFSRKQVLKRTVVNVNQFLTSTEALLRRLLPENVRITLCLDPTEQCILADTGQLVQVLLNLAKNARDAMSEGGELLIRVEQIVLTREQVAFLPDLTPGPHIRLSVCDTGVGMDRDTLQHVFEPFFTTKEVGKGTGLGLAGVYGIIKQSGGHIEAASEPGRGTTFTILMPCANISASAITDIPKKSRDFTGGSERILLVEDDDQVRKFTTLALRSAGYQVSDVRNGQEALTLATGAVTLPFDLLITDVIMPEMSGPELVTRLAPRAPDLKVLFVSGYSELESFRGNEAGRPFLGKPFAAQELLSHVHGLLRARVA